MSRINPLNTDVWVKIPPKSQLDLLGIVHAFAISTPEISVDYRDQPQFDNLLGVQGDNPKVYSFDLHYSNRNEVGKILKEGATHFLIDEDKIILRACYPHQHYSVRQREILGDVFLDYLIKNNIDISND